MARSGNIRTNVTYGAGRKRKKAVNLLVEAIVKIVKADRTSNVVHIGHGRVVTNVGDIEISIRAPFKLQLSMASERKYLKTLFTSNPISLIFQLDVWTPSRKVLNVKYDGCDLIIVSFRRGPWEDSILTAAESISIPSAKLVIIPTAPITPMQSMDRLPHVHISLTQKQLEMIRESLLRDGPFFNSIDWLLK